MAVIESTLSEVLHAKAASVRPYQCAPERILHRVRARRARLAGLAAFVAVALTAAGAAAVRMTADQHAFAAFTLVDQQHASGKNATGDGEPLTRGQLDQHVQCMRAHGVNVPDPQPSPDGWTIPVRQPPFASGKAFRNALFVDCRLQNLTENLVLGGRSEAEVDKLMACTRRHGFVLPPPTTDSSGEFEFDLGKTIPAWGSEAWYRVVFVTCAGPLPAP